MGTLFYSQDLLSLTAVISERLAAVDALDLKSWRYVTGCLSLSAQFKNHLLARQQIHSNEMIKSQTGLLYECSLIEWMINHHQQTRPYCSLPATLYWIKQYAINHESASLTALWKLLGEWRIYQLMMTLASDGLNIKEVFLVLEQARRKRLLHAEHMGLLLQLWQDYERFCCHVNLLSRTCFFTSKFNGFNQPLVTVLTRFPGRQASLFLATHLRTDKNACVGIYYLPTGDFEYQHGALFYQSAEPELYQVEEQEILLESQPVWYKPDLSLEEGRVLSSMLVQQNMDVVVSQSAQFNWFDAALSDFRTNAQAVLYHALLSISQLQSTHLSWPWFLRAQEEVLQCLELWPESTQKTQSLWLQYSLNRMYALCLSDTINSSLMETDVPVLTQWPILPTGCRGIYADVQSNTLESSFFSKPLRQFLSQAGLISMGVSEDFSPVRALRVQVLKSIPSLNDTLKRSVFCDATLENKTDLTPVKTDLVRISVSELIAYAHCPYRFYLKKTLPIYPPTQYSYFDSRQRGQLVHAVIEACLKPILKQTVTLDLIAYVLNQVGTHYQSLVAERNFTLSIPEQQKLLHQSLFDVEKIKHYLQQSLTLLIQYGGSVDSIEHAFSWNYDGLVIHGRIDRIDKIYTTQKGAQFCVWDVKTQRTPPGMNDVMALQLLVYGQAVGMSLIAALGFVSAISLKYSGYSSVPTMLFNGFTFNEKMADKMTPLMQLLEQIVNQIKINQFQPVPLLGEETCAQCEYQRICSNTLKK